MLSSWNFAFPEFYWELYNNRNIIFVDVLIYDRSFKLGHWLMVF